MKTLAFSILFALGAIAVSAETPTTPVLSSEFDNGAAVWTLPDGRIILVVPPGIDARPLVNKKTCGGPCAGRFMGEMWQLTPLKTK